MERAKAQAQTPSPQQSQQGAKPQQDGQTQAQPEAQTPSPQQSQQGAKPQQDGQTQAQPEGQRPGRNQNPFEAVPKSTEPAKPQQPAEPKQQTPFETPKTAEPAKPAPPGQEVIADIEFRGSRRVPQDTLRAMIITKRGDRFNEETLQRDFMALWNTGRFDDIRLEREMTEDGLIVRFLLTERRVVRSIKYEGAKSVTVSEILDRFKERNVGLSIESQYDPNKIQRAANVLKEFLSERGRQFATVEPDIRQVPPS
ncbi:MAG: POTRA domain-containing protein, partial [Bryobacteraceae bacterium]